jgi:hypothetical protein
MPQINETHERIIQLLDQKGPSLPIQMAKDMKMSSLFISAFLSELANEKRIKVSHLKVGGTPLYYLEGQEDKLENFYKFLHPKEAEAFLLLKQKKVLKDADQEPAIRVALRAIKDFALGFKKDNEIYWRYILTPLSEVKDILTPKTIHKQEKKPEQREISSKTKQEETTKITKPQKSDSGFYNPLATIKPQKPKKEKPKSEFVFKIINFIKENYKLTEEKKYTAKEYNCIVQVGSDLGPIKFLTRAKSKKNITIADLKSLLSEAQSIPLPAFLLYTENIAKNAKEFVKEYSSILKVKKVD